MKKGFIYKITNPNGKNYIGQTCDPNKRICAYRNLNINKQELIKNSIKKYGWENHVFTIIGEYDVDILNSKEIYFINEYNSYCKNNKNGMNMTLGGSGSRGRKDSDEIKIKRSQKIIGQKRSEKTKELMSKAKKGIPSNMLGKTHSEETKKKISIKNSNKKQTIETINKRVNSTKENFLKKHESILQYDKNTKILIKEWFESPKEIMRQTNFNDSSLIKCLKNKNKSAFNFIWKYKTNVTNE